MATDGANALEHLGVRVDVTPQLGFGGLEIGAIEGETDLFRPRRSGTSAISSSRRDPADDDVPAFAGPGAAEPTPGLRR